MTELADGYHVYHEYSAFGRRLILCDFCDADFASYYPAYFGLPDRPGIIGNDVLGFVKAIDPKPYPIIDGYCEACGRRLAFLKFLAAVRASHETNLRG